MVEVNRILFQATLKDEVSKVMAGIAKNTKKSSKRVVRNLNLIQKPTIVLSKRFGNLRIASLSVTGALAGIGAIAFQKTIFASVRRLEGFQKQMNVVGAITRSTGKDFKALEDFAIELGRTTIFSASQASEAMTGLARSGKDVNEIFKILPAVLNTAAAGQLQLANASRIVQNVLAVSNLRASEAVRISDLLAATSSRSRSTIDGLGKSFELLAGTQRDVNLTVEETFSLLAVLAERGIVASRAGTSLASAFSSLVKPTKAAQDVLERIGVATLDASGNIRNFVDFIEDLERANISATDKAILFEKRGLRAINAILTETTANARKFTKGLQDIGGEAARLAEEFQVGLPGAFKRTESATDAFLIRLGKIFEPATIEGLGLVTDQINLLSGSMSNASASATTLVRIIFAFEKFVLRASVGIDFFATSISILFDGLVLGANIARLSVREIIELFIITLPKGIVAGGQLIKRAFFNIFTSIFTTITDQFTDFLATINIAGALDSIIIKISKFEKDLKKGAEEISKSSAASVEKTFADIDKKSKEFMKSICFNILDASDKVEEATENINNAFSGFEKRAKETSANIALINVELENLIFNIERAEIFKKIAPEISPETLDLLLKFDLLKKLPESLTLSSTIIVNAIKRLNKILKKEASDLIITQEAINSELLKGLSRIAGFDPDEEPEVRFVITFGASETFSDDIATIANRAVSLFDKFSKGKFELKFELDAPVIPEISPFIEPQLKALNSVQEQLNIVNKNLKALGMLPPDEVITPGITGKFIQLSTDAGLLAEQIDNLKKSLIELGVPEGLISVITEPPKKPEDEAEPFSPFTGIAAGLFEFTDATNVALEDFETRFGDSADAIQIIATGIEDVFNEVTASVVGGFIDQAIAGEFSAKALAASAFQALSGVLRAVAIEASIKGALALALGEPGKAGKLFAVAALAGVGAIAAGIVAKSLTPKEEERKRAFAGGRRAAPGAISRVEEMPVAEFRGGGGVINITVFGFVGNEQELGSALAPIIRQAVGDDVDFGINVELA